MMYNFVVLTYTILWFYIVIKGKQVVDDSVPRCFFTRRTKDLKLPVRTESLQMDINGKVNIVGQKKMHKSSIHNTYT